MNANGLAKLYDRLTPWERLALLVAAKRRGDEAEQRRLASSAPKVNWAVCDYFGLALGMERLALSHHLKQLAFAAHFRHAEILFESPWAGQSKEDRKRQDQARTALRVMCHRFVAEADGWKRLCEELSLDPEALLRDLPGYELVREFEKLARPLAAFCADEIRAALEARECPIPSPEDLARSMREFLTEQLAEWSGLSTNNAFLALGHSRKHDGSAVELGTQPAHPIASPRV